MERSTLLKNDSNIDRKVISPTEIINKIKLFFVPLFGLFIAIGAGLAQFLFNKANNPNNQTMPWYFWSIPALCYLVLSMIVVAVVRASVIHYNKNHSIPNECFKIFNTIPDEIKGKFDKVCAECAKLRTKQARACSEAIEKINSEADKQARDVEEVKTLLEYAKTLEEKYNKAIQNSLINNNYLANIEKQVEDGIIYIMTSKFKLELEEPMRDSLIENLNQGVRYYYIIPANRTMEFTDMVRDIINDDRFNKEGKNKDYNDFLIAAYIPEDIIMLTIAYYPLPNNESEVIIKLPSDTESAKDPTAIETYRVPKGAYKREGEYPNHKDFKEKLSGLFDDAYSKNNIIRLSINEAEKTKH